MHPIIKEILNEFDKRKKCIEMDFVSDNWRNDIPAEPGWYIIKTNTPANVLRSLGKPKGKSHYNIRERIDQILLIHNKEIIITQTDDEFYTIYNGHAQNLKSRAREHDRGHNSTACLALRQYRKIHKYNWYFCFLSVLQLGNKFKDNKILRKAVEQGWRTEFGWPVLCKG